MDRFFGFMLDLFAVAAAKADASRSAEVVGKDELPAPRPQSGDTSHERVAGVTSRDIQLEVYKKLGWPS